MLKLDLTTNEEIKKKICKRYMFTQFVNQNNVNSLMLSNEETIDISYSFYIFNTFLSFFL